MKRIGFLLICLLTSCAENGYVEPMLTDKADKLCKDIGSSWKNVIYTRSVNPVNPTTNIVYRATVTCNNSYTKQLLIDSRTEPQLNNTKEPQLNNTIEP